MIRLVVMVLTLLPIIGLAAETAANKRSILSLEEVLTAAKKAFPGLLSTEQRKHCGRGRF
jgi:hypothetical protein